MVWWIVGVLIYLIVPPLSVFGIHRLHKNLRIEKPQQPKKNGKPRTKVDPNSLPDELRFRYKELMKFARKDKGDLRLSKKKTLPIKKRYVLFCLWAVGFVLCVVGFGTQHFIVALVGFFLWYAYFIFGLTASLRSVKAINRQIDTMYGIAKANLKYPADANHKTSKDIKITKWRDPMTPSEIEIKLGPNLNASVEEPFMRTFNLYFGQETTWVPSYDKEKGHDGWDYKNGKLNIYSVPPLPGESFWKEWFINNEAVSPSFFPIGESVEGGLELEDPETKEIKHVMGFDLSGKAKDYAKAAGVKLSPKIVAAPQVLIAGRTGSGKAMDVNTPVLVYGKDEKFVASED